MRPSCDSRGFTLLEIVVVIGVLAVLTATLVPVVAPLLDQAKITQTLRLIETLRKSCNMFYEDMHTFPTELELQDNPTSAAAHQLTQSQGGTWKGPYLENPYARTDSPCEGYTGVFRPLTAAPSDAGGLGFDLDGSGTEETAGDGAFLVLRGCGSRIAQRMNALLDAGVPGAWDQGGRVEYDAGVDRVAIYLTGGR